MDIEELKQELKRTFSETPLLWLIFFFLVLVPLLVIIISRVMSARPIF